MGLTTERKVFVGILFVAGAALVIDQGFLGPSEASAMPPTAPAASDLLITPSSSPAQTSKGSTLSMAQVLLDRLGASESSPDVNRSLGSAFSLDQLMQASIATTTGEQNEPSVEPALPTISRDAPDLPALSSVMPSKNGGGAVLGGKLYRVGQETPEGFILREVRERGVILERDGVTYAVTIPVHVQP